MRSTLTKAISGFVCATRCSAGTPARSNRTRSLVQLSGRKRRSVTITGTSPRASVSDTSVWQLAFLPRAEAYCEATDRMLALLRQRSVVDHQHRIAAADEPVRLNEQFCLQRCRIPDASGNEMVQLIIVARRKPLRHRLNALAIARTDQPRHVKWTHPPPCLVTQAIQKWLEPAPKLAFPIRRRAHHGQPSKSRPPMNH